MHMEDAKNYGCDVGDDALVCDLWLCGSCVDSSSRNDAAILAGRAGPPWNSLADKADCAPNYRHGAKVLVCNMWRLVGCDCD